MSRIRWTWQEEEAVKQELLNIARMANWLAVPKAIYRAQEILPPERRKKENAFYGEKKWYSSKWAEAKELAAKTVAEPPKEKEEKKDTLDTVITVLCARVMQELQPRLQQHFQKLLSFAIANLSSVPTTYPKLVAEQKKEKGKIVIVGLIGTQVTETCRAYQGDFSLVFVNADSNLKALPAKLENCDKCILLTNFVSHAHQEIIKSKIPGKLLYANGGVSGVWKVLNHLLEKQE